MYNTRTVQLEKDIIDLVNNANIHISTAKLVVDKVARMINDTLQDELKKEKEIEDNTNQYSVIV